MRILQWNKYNFMCSLFSVFTLFFIKSWKTCQLMWENFVFLVIFDTCDVVYNWPISLLLPLVLNNLFEFSSWRLFRPSVCSYQESMAYAFLKKNVQKMNCFSKKIYLTCWHIKRKKIFHWEPTTNYTDCSYTLPG